MRIRFLVFSLVLLAGAVDSVAVSQPSVSFAGRLLAPMAASEIPGIKFVRAEDPSENRVKNPFADLVQWADTIPSLVPLSVNDTTRQILSWLLTDERKSVVHVLALLRHQEPLIEVFLEQQKLPRELKILPAVVSGGNPVGSWSGGAGYWHLYFPHARKNGLIVTNEIDQRLDPELSGKAAAKVIRSELEKNADWHEVLRVYAGGPLYRNIADEDLAEWIGTLGEQFTVWLYLHENASRLGLDGRNALPVGAETVHPRKKIPFGLIASVTGIEKSQMAMLNPVLISETALPGELRLPAGKASLYLEKEELLHSDSLLVKPAPEPPKTEVYRVRSGDTLSEIASRYRVSVAEIREWNGLRSNTIYAGQELIIHLEQ